MPKKKSSEIRMLFWFLTSKPSTKRPVFNCLLQPIYVRTCTFPLQATPHKPFALNLVQRASRGMKSLAELIGLGMSVVFILLLIAKLIWKKIRGTESTAVTEAQMISDSETETEHSINGLKPVAAASLPTMEFNKEAFRSREDPHCSICLEDYKDKEVLRTLPRCGHNFHHTCIDIWFQKQSTCPVCRLSLHDSFKAKHMVSPTFSTAV